METLSIIILLYVGIYALYLFIDEKIIHKQEVSRDDQKKLTNTQVALLKKECEYEKQKNNRGQYSEDQQKNNEPKVQLSALVITWNRRMKKEGGGYKDLFQIIILFPFFLVDVFIHLIVVFYLFQPIFLFPIAGLIVYERWDYFGQEHHYDDLIIFLTFIAIAWYGKETMLLRQKSGK